ncbi:MAG: aspartate aminotransferase family protein [Deltaproteobacteria bacterium]|nr:aspartate aminotransferase family protein [Deltaproteobacteria bacterium]
MKQISLPKKGISKEEVLSNLRSFKSGDADWHDGRMFGLIYNAGLDVEEMVKEAYATYMFENALSPFAFPSLLKMETEFISMVSALFGGDDETVGSMTSGGTESILMAVKAAREWARAKRPEIKIPELIAPITIHPAWNKAADFLGLKIVLTPVDEEFKADVKAMQEVINENTIMLGASAVTYPHGVVDPINELGAIAEEKNLWLHVDACLGGYILPFLRTSGYDIPPFDFSVPGVQSMSVDIHKYGYTSKGASTVLYRNKELRQHQFFVYTDWPGGVYATPCLSGARPGGAIASAWAMLHYLGEEGFLKLARAARETTLGLMEGIRRIPGLFILGNPPATVFAFGSNEINVYKLAVKLKERGWHIDSQHRPPSLHMTISPAHEKIIEPFLKDLQESAKEVSGTDSGEASGMAALYGMMGTMPDRKMARTFALQYLNDLYRLK